MTKDNNVSVVRDIYESEELGRLLADGGHRYYFTFSLFLLLLGTASIVRLMFARLLRGHGLTEPNRDRWHTFLCIRQRTIADDLAQREDTSRSIIIVDNVPVVEGLITPRESEERGEREHIHELPPGQFEVPHDVLPLKVRPLVGDPTHGAEEIGGGLNAVSLL